MFSKIPHSLFSFPTIPGIELDVTCAEANKSVSGIKLTMYWGWQTYNKNTNNCIIINYQYLKESGHWEGIAEEI